MKKRGKLEALYEGMPPRCRETLSFFERDKMNQRGKQPRDIEETQVDDGEKPFAPKAGINLVMLGSTICKE